MIFSLPWPNADRILVDLDIHPSPPEGWSRVAVIGGWDNAKKTREKWPDVAVVGPLRTLPGIDLLVRSILANPQLRVLVWDGPDLTPGEVVHKALMGLFVHRQWADGPSPVPEADGNTRTALLNDVALATEFNRQFHPWATKQVLAEGSASRYVHIPSAYWSERPSNEDRPGGAIILPPPAPEPTDRAPHGDPGDRIAGDTLADVWPRVLQRVIVCGREAPTQHGPTRELLNLVSVIRDPVRSAALIGEYPVCMPKLNTNPAMCERCGKPVDNSEAPCSAVPVEKRWHPNLLRLREDKVKAYYERLTGPEIPKDAEYTYGSRMRGGAVAQQSGLPSWCWPDQVENVLGKNGLLAQSPDTRAAFLSPWRVDEDCGKEANRPCLVGAWFRRTAREGMEVAESAMRRRAAGDTEAPEPLYALHLTICFRSHDTFGAYGHNIATACLWLMRTAEAHGMAVGTLTCLSMSAHVYERDLAAAQEVVAKYKPPPGPRWDRRTIWHVERTPEGLRATAYAVERRDAEGNVAPGQGGVVAVVEAKTPETLMRHLAESGLIQETGSALWLGREVERVWRSR